MATNNKRLIELALKGLQAEREKISQEIAELQKLAGGTVVTAPAHKAAGAGPAATGSSKKRRPMTAAQKRAISATMKAKWAARRKAEAKG